MRHSEMVELIREGCDVGGTWAELGAGRGNFTWALRDLIGPQGTIVAIDRDPRAIQQLRQRIARAGKGATIQPIQADFTRPLNLPLLDGILIANALHFIRKQVATVKKLASYLRAGGHFLVVEYDVCATSPWIPFPLGKKRFIKVALKAGLSKPILIGSRRSPSSGITMYAALARKL